MKNIILFGNQQVAIDCIQYLLNSPDANLLAVVGCETDEDPKLGYPSLEKFCKANSIVYFNPKKLDDVFLKKIRDFQPDICYSIYYRKIFKHSFIDIPPYGFINLHPSLLPFYRGPIPSVWALLQGELKTGVTMHYIDQGIDTGDIIDQSECQINSHISGFELHVKLMKIGYELFKKQLPLILSNKNKRIKQSKKIGSYYGSYDDKLRKIHWLLPIRKIEDKIRTFSKPYQGAYGIINQYKVLFWVARSVKQNFNILNGPGKIISVHSNSKFVVTCADGFLEVDNYEILNCPKNEWPALIKLGQKFTL